jgi:hypothetical protein
MGFPLLPATMPWFSYSDLGANCEARKLLAFSCQMPGFLAQTIAGIRAQISRSGSRHTSGRILVSPGRPVMTALITECQFANVCGEDLRRGRLDIPEWGISEYLIAENAHRNRSSDSDLLCSFRSAIYHGRDVDPRAVTAITEKFTAAALLIFVRGII